jgi:PRELI-like family
VQTVLGGTEYSYVHETSYVDPAKKSVTMVSSNMTWSRFLNVRETVVYEPVKIAAPGSLISASSDGVVEQNTNSQERTQFRQEAKIIALCGGWQKVRTKIEEASIERFAENASKGREGFEAVLRMSRRVFGEEKEKEKMGAKM